MDLYTKSDSQAFYEDRYSKGYMEEWPLEKQRRIYQLLKSLDLPEFGEALDFGCGNGIFTYVLKKALPTWDVYGCDLSSTAIHKASNRFPQCTFFMNGDERYKDKTFDLIFSHHVLEHVFDIHDVTTQIANHAKPTSVMFHVLPCGNPGSYEYNLCKQVTNGINLEMENRFFFEDEGHVRRLTTEQCENIFKAFDFNLFLEYYSNQKWGGVYWISNSGIAFINNMFEVSKGIDMMSKISIAGKRGYLIPLAYANRITTLYDSISSLQNKNAKHQLFLALAYIPHIAANISTNYMKRKAEKEWNQAKHQKNGSEMHLIWKRSQL